MATPRHTRKSVRASSPLAGGTKRKDPPTTDESTAQRPKTMLDEWVEPPLRTPAPSFEDHKGLERGGVLEYIQPLGTMPGQKVRSRVRIDGPKKAMRVKSSKPRETKARTETPGTDGSTSAAVSGKEDGQTHVDADGVTEDDEIYELENDGTSKDTKETFSNPFTPVPPPLEEDREAEDEDDAEEDEEEDEDEDEDTTTPLTTSHPTITPARLAVASHTLQTPISQAPQTTPGRSPRVSDERLTAAVREVIEIAKRKEKIATGMAIQQFCLHSQKDPALLQVLEAVLDQHMSADQVITFRDFINSAKKEHKAKFKPSPRKSIGKTKVSSANHSTPKASPSSKGRRKSLRSSGVASVAGRTKAITLEATASSANLPDGPDGEATTSASRPKKIVYGATTVNGTQAIHRSRSSSSLSSLPSDEHGLVDPQRSSGGKANDRSAETPAGRKLTATTSATTNSGPKRLVLTAPRLPTSSNLKRSSDAAGFPEDEVTLEAKKQKLSKPITDYVVRESDVRASGRRGRTSTTGPVPRSSSAAPAATPTQPARQTLRLRNTRQTRSVQRDESADLTTPFSSSPLESQAPPASKDDASRQGTPLLGRAARQVKKSARVKMSPVKKKAGVIAGMPRAETGRNSPVGYGGEDSEESHNNNDYCSACGGSGQLLCCDGCARSFHFTCLDPPMDPDNTPEEQWFCYVCEAKRESKAKPSRGLFAGVFTNLEKKNPVAFNLPVDLRDYFEGVKTGEEGEYEEAVANKSKARGGGWEEAPDLRKLVDAKGHFVTCFKCGKSSLTGREILPCDFCNLQWHLDCLDPPMANAPRQTGKLRPTWMCPNHIDHELLALDPAVRRNQSGVVFHKIRRPKNAKIIDTYLNRGFKNNGLIEIENEDEDEAFYDHQEFGVVYRLPEKGIKLDFISKVKEMRAREQPLTNGYHPTTVGPSDGAIETPSNEIEALETTEVHEDSVELSDDFSRRSILDRKAALNLVQMAAQDPELDFSRDRLENLLGLLIAEAPDDVVMSMDHPSTSNTITSPSRKLSAHIPASPPTPESGADQQQSPETSKEKERNTLQLLHTLIKRRLAKLNDTEA